MSEIVLKRIEAKCKKAIDMTEAALEYSFKKHICRKCHKPFIPRLCNDVTICYTCETGIAPPTESYAESDD